MPVIIEQPIRLSPEEKERNRHWEEAFRENGEGWVRVLTGSMTPLIRGDDCVLVYPVQPARVGRGDILLFRQADEMIVHRILSIRHSSEGTFILQEGDRGGGAFWIPWQSVIGRVVAVEKGEKTVWLDSGRMALWQRVLGWHFYFVFLLEKQLMSLKGRLRNIPGMRRLRYLVPYVNWVLSRLRLLPLLVINRICSRPPTPACPAGRPPSPLRREGKGEGR